MSVDTLNLVVECDFGGGLHLIPVDQVRLVGIWTSPTSTTPPAECVGCYELWRNAIRRGCQNPHESHLPQLRQMDVLLQLRKRIFESKEETYHDRQCLHLHDYSPQRMGEEA